MGETDAKPNIEPNTNRRQFRIGAWLPIFVPMAAA
jgi:hypothetical protein